MNVWFRVLTVTLTNKTSRLVFGGNDETTDYNYDIAVTGSKYLSSLKDECTISINNLSYETLTRIIDEKIYSVEVNCGYKEGSTMTIFKGEVLWITDSLNSDRTHTCKILCASALVAKYGQARMSLSLQGGLNLYTILTYASKVNGIKNARISEKLKATILQEPTSTNETFSAWLNRLSDENEYLMINSNGTNGATFSIYDARYERGTRKRLSKDFINLDGGYPKLTKQGLTFSMMPMIELQCGDIIQLDKDIIDISISSKDEISENRGYYLDKEGRYLLFSYSYQLENHGDSFSLSLNCKSYSLISNYLNIKE